MKGGKGEDKKAKAFVTETVPCDSFFNTFDPPKVRFPMMCKDKGRGLAWSGRSVCVLTGTLVPSAALEHAHNLCNQCLTLAALLLPYCLITLQIPTDNSAMSDEQLDELQEELTIDFDIGYSIKVRRRMCGLLRLGAACMVRRGGALLGWGTRGVTSSRS